MGEPLYIKMAIAPLPDQKPVTAGNQLLVKFAPVTLDDELDMAGAGFSPGLRRLMSKVGSEFCFEKGRDFIFELAGVRVSDKDVERESESVWN